MKTKTHMLAEELYESTTETGSKAIIDMRSHAEKKGQSPVELLLSALSACAAVDIVGMLKKRKKTIINFTIDADGTRQEELPRYFTKIHCHYTAVSPDVTEDEFKKTAALALEKYCSVASSLKAEITFSVQVTRPS